MVTEKVTDGNKIVKARLVIQGFQEEQITRADSPTCSKDNMRLLLAVSLARGWVIHSLDVKAAFLQGREIERDVYIKTPKEANSNKPIWRLRKVVYGLCDASRSW